MPSTQSRIVRTITAAAVASLSWAALHGDVTPATQAVDLPATQPAPTTAPVVTTDVDQLIKQLGSDNADDRDAAQKQLVALGKSVSDKLKKAAEDDDDPEVRSRASAALALMKDHDDNDTSLITLHQKDAPAQDVLNAIAKQAHAQFGGLGSNGLVPQLGTRTISIDADSKPFWDVMTDVCTQLNVCPMLDSSNRNSIRLFPTTRNWITGSPHQVVGPYWLGVAGVYRSRSIDLQGPQTIDDQFSIRLIVYPEPKLAVTQISDLKLLEATDDAGNSLIPKPAAAAAQMGMINSVLRVRQVTHMIEARLQYPDSPGKKISLLRGEVNALLAQDLQRFEVDDVLGTPRQSNPPEHCTVKATISKRGTSDMYQVILECTRDGLSDDKWTAMQSRMNDITLEDSDGHALVPLSIFIATPTSDNSFTGTCLFSRSALGMNIVVRAGGAGVAAPAQPATKSGEPKKLTWNVANSLKSVKIPVEFKDLPMP